jgi:aspartate-semialdehyde dehydrogenase
MPSTGSSNRVAIVGASSLRGKELKLVLEERNFPASEIILLDESIMAGTLTEAGGEPTFIRALNEESFEGARFVFFAGTAFDAERNWLAAERVGATVIDMTGAVASSGRFVSWIPSLDSILPQRTAHGTNGSAHPKPYFSPPTPVVIACILAASLVKFPAPHLALVMFPPVSEKDQPGIDELETQTTNLLSFRPIEQTIFDAQVAFNLLSGYGEASKPSLSDIRKSIADEVGRYLAGRAPTPAVQLLQAPVFYGYSFSAFAKWESQDVSPAEVEAALANLGVVVATATDPPPTLVSVAGENSIHISPIDWDLSDPAGMWIWGVADHLRLAATNAVRIAEELVAKSVAS